MTSKTSPASATSRRISEGPIISFPGAKFYARFRILSSLQPVVWGDRCERTPVRGLSLPFSVPLEATAIPRLLVVKLGGQTDIRRRACTVSPRRGWIGQQAEGENGMTGMSSVCRQNSTSCTSLTKARPLWINYCNYIVSLSLFLSVSPFRERGIRDDADSNWPETCARSFSEDGKQYRQTRPRARSIWRRFNKSWMYQVVVLGMELSGTFDTKSMKKRRTMLERGGNGEYDNGFIERVFEPKLYLNVDIFVANIISYSLLLRWTFIKNAVIEWIQILRSFWNDSYSNATAGHRVKETIGLLSFRRNIYTKKGKIQIGQGIAIIIRTKGELILSSIPDTASGLTFSNWILDTLERP